MDQTRVNANTSPSPPRLSIVLPTCGRDSLHRTLLSIQAQEILPGDDLIVVADGAVKPWVREVMAELDMPCSKRLLTHGPTRNFGNAQRTFALGLAHGEYVTFMDDDDVYTPDAFVKIRKAIAQAPSTSAFLFKVVAPWGEVVWTDEGVIEQGNVCTIQLVVPNVRALLPPWGLRQGANIPWTRAIEARWPLVWRKEIIAQCRPLL